MKFKVLVICISVAFMIFGCKNKSKEEKDVRIPHSSQPQNSVDTVVKKDSVVITPSKPDKTAKANVEHYYVVAGCFVKESNAIRFHAALEESGYNSQIIPYGPRYKMVTYGSYPTAKEAQRALNELTFKKKINGLWVYKSKRK